MKPCVWLGAYSPGGLALPAANPTAAQLYAPRGVYHDEQLLVVADSGNHRILIWHNRPTQDGQPADVVLGQPDFTTEGAQAGGHGPTHGFHLPTGVTVIDGRLYVADAWNHRVLVWNEVPQRSFTPPDYALGQANLSDVSENRGQEVSATSFYWPYGLGYVAGWFYVADTGNRRVVGWRGLPEPGQAPDLILGQATPTERLENRGGAVAVDTLRWPHGIAGNGDALYVADAGNHRVLGWSPRPAHDQPATHLLGQPNFASAQEWPYGPQAANRLRFPYAVTFDEHCLAVADTANNRVLFWEWPLACTLSPAASAVIGQPDFTANGENRWKAVTHDTLCWPYGIHLHRGTLAVADSGNNRVMIWDVQHKRTSSPTSSHND